MGGRRAHYTTRIAKRLCEHIALGDTLKKALEKEPLGPTVIQFWRWLDEYPEFQQMYERALLLQAQLLGDVIMDMAQSVLRQPKFAPAFKVASDILRWQAEIKNPARFGSKTVIEHKITLDPKKMRAEIAQLETDLGLMGNNDVMDIEMKELK